MQAVRGQQAALTQLAAPLPVWAPAAAQQGWGPQVGRPGQHMQAGLPACPPRSAHTARPPGSFPPCLPASPAAPAEAAYGRLLAPYLADPSNLFIISSDFCHWGRRFGYTFHEPERVSRAGRIQGWGQGWRAGGASCQKRAMRRAHGLARTRGTGGSGHEPCAGASGAAKTFSTPCRSRPDAGSHPRICRVAGPAGHGAD